MVHMLLAFERALQLLVLSSDILFVNWDTHPCYAYAMIGSDAVINARLGVPADVVLKLAEIPASGPVGENTYSILLLTTLLEAYLWEQSPYHYSIQVFQQCAESARTQGARQGLPVAMQFSQGSDMIGEE